MSSREERLAKRKSNQKKRKVSGQKKMNMTSSPLRTGASTSFIPGKRTWQKKWVKWGAMDIYKWVPVEKTDPVEQERSNLKVFL